MEAPPESWKPWNSWNLWIFQDLSSPGISGMNLRRPNGRAARGRRANGPRPRCGRAVAAADRRTSARRAAGRSADPAMMRRNMGHGRMVRIKGEINGCKFCMMICMYDMYVCKYVSIYRMYLLYVSIVCRYVYMCIHVYTCVYTWHIWYVYVRVWSLRWYFKH